MESNLSGKYLMAEDDEENANTERTRSDDIFRISFQSKKKQAGNVNRKSAGGERTICLHFGQHRSPPTLPLFPPDDL